MSLLIDKCVPEDDGEYTLTAINMAGEETNTARVFVVGEYRHVFASLWAVRSLFLN